MSADSETLPCPTCGRAVATAEDKRPSSFPFCCPRCRLRDLGAWIDGTHVIAGTPLVFDPEAPDFDHP